MALKIISKGYSMKVLSVISFGLGLASMYVSDLSNWSMVVSVLALGNLGFWFSKKNNG